MKLHVVKHADGVIKEMMVKKFREKYGNHIIDFKRVKNVVLLLGIFGDVIHIITLERYLEIEQPIRNVVEKIDFESVNQV